MLKLTNAFRNSKYLNMYLHFTVADYIISNNVCISIIVRIVNIKSQKLLHSAVKIKKFIRVVRYNIII